jgi:hypothetical protein
MLYIPISMIRKYAITSAPRHGNRFLKMPRRADLGQILLGIFLPTSILREQFITTTKATLQLLENH